MKKRPAVHFVSYARPTHTAWVSVCGLWRPARAQFKRIDRVTCGRCRRAMRAKR